jgi:hypothetical protein
VTSQQPDPQIVAIAAAYQRQTRALRDQVEQYIEALWRSLGIYRDPQKATFVKEITPVILGAEKQMLSLTSAYMASNRQLTIGGTSTPARVTPSKLTGSATRNGVSPEEVYGRPFHKVWRDLGNNVEPDRAIARGLTNAKQAASSDLQRTKVLTSQEIISGDPKATWFERILEGSHSCGLCIVASTQRYRKQKLLPMHPGCDCGVQCHYGDPSQEPLNLPRLQDVHQAIENTFGQSSSAAREIPDTYVDGKPVKYKDVLVVHEHGELGPVLAVKGHRFTGPDDLAA